MSKKIEKASQGNEVTGREVEISDEHIDTYCDDTLMTTSFFGITFRFNQVLRKREGEKLIVQEKARVSMSAEHARSVYDLIGRQLEKYESNFGKIRSAPQAEDEATEPHPTPTH